MIGTSLAEYVLIRASIFAIRAVLPLSAAYLASRAFLAIGCPFAALDWYAATEVLFYPLVFLPLKHVSQRAAVHPELLPRQKREALFRQCFGNIDNLPAYLSQWFLNAPLSEIKRDNVREYLLWAFFNTGSVDPQHEDEIDGYVKAIETTRGEPFAPGRGRAECLRLTLDRVEMIHRPLLWYIIMFGIDIVNHVGFMLLGFAYHKPAAAGMAFLTIFPPRPQLLLSRSHSISKQVSYFAHAHTSETHLPILFLHGIGIGPISYLAYLKAINAKRPASDQIGIFVIELMSISFRITSPPLSGPALAAEIADILQSHGVSKCLLVAHSYGTAVTPHILRHPATAPLVAGCVLVDPVSIMLHRPAVAYNFVRRVPRDANEWQLYFFASTDPGVARTLGRSFFWADNILWEQDWAPRPMTVALAARDLIVDTPCVAAYLTAGQWQGSVVTGDAKDDKLDAVEGWQRNDGRVRVLWAPRLDHAQVFDVAANRAVLVEETIRAAAITRPGP